MLLLSPFVVKHTQICHLMILITSLLQVCATTRRSAAEVYSSRSRRAIGGAVYFSQETQFAVGSISSSIVNDAPYFVNLDTSHTINEGDGEYY